MSFNIEEQVLSLLEPGVFKTTDQVVEEFRMEFPEEWKALQKEGEMLFGSSCSSVQQPATRISLVLRSYPDKHVLCLQDKEKILWALAD